MALVAVFSLLNLTHVSANLLSLGAIDFGILVDGAIVVTEAILRRREAMPDEELSESEVKAAAVQVTRPIFFASLIIITAYLPLFSFERAEAKLFTPMAYTMGYALFGALLTTLALVPGLAYFAFRKPGPRLSQPLARVADRCATTAFCTTASPSRVSSTAWSSLRCWRWSGSARTVGREFLPDLDEGALWLQVQMPTGLSLDKASDMASELRRAVLKFPEVSYIVTQTGRNDDGTDPWTMSHIEAPVGLKPYDTWPDGETKRQFLDRFADKLSHDLPGLLDRHQPADHRRRQRHDRRRAQPAGHQDLRRRPGRAAPHRRADRRRAVHHPRHLERLDLPGAADPADRDRDRSREGRALRHQHRRLQNVIQTGVGQAPVSTVYVGERIYNLTVRYLAVSRDSPEALGNLLRQER